jgi:hypothetical protein
MDWKKFWLGPWGSAIRQVYVVAISAAITAALDQVLKMDMTGQAFVFVAVQMFVKALEKQIRAWVSAWAATTK